MADQYQENNKTYEERICEILKGCIKRGDYQAGALIIDQDRKNLSPETCDKYRKQIESKLGRIITSF